MKSTSQPIGDTAVYLFDDWFDLIEAQVRERVRGFIHAMIEGELDGENGSVIAVSGHRYGHRTRSLTGTFGTTDIKVPARSVGFDIGAIASGAAERRGCGAHAAGNTGVCLGQAESTAAITRHGFHSPVSDSSQVVTPSTAISATTNGVSDSTRASYASARSESA